MPPAEPPRLHLDEHLSPQIAVQLRKFGYDVTSSQEAVLLSKEDRDQFAYAAAEQRVMVTCDVADYMHLHEQYVTANQEHWGLVLSTDLPTNILLRRLLRLVSEVSAPELKNQVRWLNDFK
jgi:predicted nuclease of predicted toxin-antitoxin system